MLVDRADPGKGAHAGWLRLGQVRLIRGVAQTSGSGWTLDEEKWARDLTS